MDNTTKYYTYRLKLEILKRRTWILIVLSRLLLFLVALAAHC